MANGRAVIIRVGFTEADWAQLRVFRSARDIRRLIREAAHDAAERELADCKRLAERETDNG